ncbi:MAG TPA: hypothetical protein VFP85_12850 [Vicinamibacterales bacterium]|nr:hypothetical protein [Vicinamibacterales bacterium]
MKRTFLTAAGLLMAGALTLNAQAPQTPPTPQQQPQPRPTEPQTRPADPTRGAAQAAADQVVTITGCLKQEKDVPGLTPNPAERAGVTEDYILTEVKMAASSKVSGLALSGMYEVEGIDESELKKHLNHQVEVTGKIAGAATASDKTPNFSATSLKMVAATCPAK